MYQRADLNGGRRALRRTLRLLVALGLVAASAVAPSSTSTAQPGGQAEEGEAPPHATGAPGFAVPIGRAHGGKAALTAPGGVTKQFDEIALQVMGCASRSGVPTVNEVNSTVIALPGGPTVGTTGKVVSRGLPTTSPTMADSQESATVDSVNLLNGVVKATQVQARAHSRRDSTGLSHFSAADSHPSPADGSTGSTFVDLVVAGQAISQSTAPNHEIPLPLGIGRVVLNEQVIAPDGVTVNAIHVYITNFLGVSGDLVIASARSNVGRPSPVRMSGRSYAALASLDPLTSTGEQSVVYMGCTGTGGKDVIVTGSAVAIPAPNGQTLLSSSTAKSLVNGTFTMTGAKAKGTETVQSLSMLDGRITAQVVDVKAETVAAGGSIQSTGSTVFTQLVVDGRPLDAPAPNTTVTLPGLGRVTFNEQACTSDRPDDPSTAHDESKGCTGDHHSAIRVFAIRVKVSVADNPFGLPVGAQVLVGASRTGVQF
jgi:hypothetical protein